MFEKFTAMAEPCKKDAPEMLQKLKVVPEMFEKLTAMQDRAPQRCLQSSQPCRKSISEMFEKADSHAG